MIRDIYIYIIRWISIEKYYVSTIYTAQRTLKTEYWNRPWYIVSSIRNVYHHCHIFWCVQKLYNMCFPLCWKKDLPLMPYGLYYPPGNKNGREIYIVLFYIVLQIGERKMNIFIIIYMHHKYQSSNQHYINSRQCSFIRQVNGELFIRIISFCCFFVIWAFNGDGIPIQ